MVWDTQQRGLALRVQPTGSRSWVMVYSRHGRPRWLASATPTPSASPMRACWPPRRCSPSPRARTRPLRRKAERSAGTFADLATDYVEQHAKQHNKSWRQADALVRRYRAAALGQAASVMITRGDVKAMMARIEAPMLANQVLAAVERGLLVGRQGRIVAANPCSG